MSTENTTPHILTFDNCGINVDGQRFATIRYECQVPTPDGGWRMLSWDERNALGRLLGAAGEMLEALKAVDHSETYIHERSEARHKAREAIAKATGE